MKLRTLIGQSVLWLSVSATPACGRDTAKPATAPVSAGANAEASEDAGPATLTDAERQFEQARSELERVARIDLTEPRGARDAPPSPPSPAAAQAVPAAPAPAGAAAAERRADEAAADDRSAKDGPDCQTTCRAYASLARATEAVCRLDNPGGGRCTRARQIREEAARRVASCGCSAE